MWRCRTLPPALPSLPCRPQVVQWEQGLTAPMEAIQGAVVEVMEALIRELSRTNKIDWWGWGGEPEALRHPSTPPGHLPSPAPTRPRPQLPTP
jgi:hypothetical protein